MYYKTNEQVGTVPKGAVVTINTGDEITVSISEYQGKHLTRIEHQVPFETYDSKFFDTLDTGETGLEWKKITYGIAPHQVVEYGDKLHYVYGYVAYADKLPDVEIHPLNMDNCKWEHSVIVPPQDCKPIDVESLPEDQLSTVQIANFFGLPVQDF